MLSTASKRKIVVIGCGPTGLGAAWRLNELGHENWVLVDAQEDAGGLANSFQDEAGFWWDLGGHVIFSHYTYFDQVLNHCVGEDNFEEHQRESWVRMHERWVPYPFQNNIRLLPPAELSDCLNGLVDIARSPPREKPKNFEEWIQGSFGAGIARVFMIPYNWKVWAYPAQEMSSSWVGERVATIDLKRILHNVCHQKDDVGWGPNATFRFPKHGGTGSIWKAIAAKLPSERFHFNRSVTRIDARSKVIHYADGTSEPYDAIISTVPIDQMCTSIVDTGDAQVNADLVQHASKFKYSSSHIIGIGIDGAAPEEFATKCWMYFPEDNCPFYRVTVFSNYAAANVPNPGKQWSLMCEVSESSVKPVDSDTIVQQCIDGAIATGLLQPDAVIVSRWYKRLHHGYPTPFVERDDLLQHIQPVLRECASIWSRGRFGGWKYEVANQDHSMMQGVEAVDSILFGAEETTYQYPSVINRRKATGRTAACAAPKE